MKSKLLGALCALIAIGLPVQALAQIGVVTTPSDFDVRYKPKDEGEDDLNPDRVDPPRYYTLPDLELPNRTLPAAFTYPILYELAVDRSITSDAVITDEVFIANLTPIPNGITLDDIPRLRAEYTRQVQEWGELVQECLRLDPLIVKTDTGNPVLIAQQPAGTIFLNANNISVCPTR
ncbi:MAG: hypothetical protein ACP5D7_05950 [Limnospira sp.]